MIEGCPGMCMALGSKHRWTDSVVQWTGFRHAGSWTSCSTLSMNSGATLQPQLQTRFPKTWHIFTLFLVPNNGGVFCLFSSCEPTRWLRGLKAPDVQGSALNLISKTTEGGWKELRPHSSPPHRIHVPCSTDTYCSVVINDYWAIYLFCYIS